MVPESRKRININLLIPFLVIALVFGIAIWKKYRASHEIPAAPQLQQPVGTRTAVLFFVAEGTRLEREAREMDPCDDVTSCLKGVLEELVNGPVGEFDESLPKGTAINSVRIDGDLAGIDLNKTFVEALPSGSSAEMLAVYSIVDTVVTNFPQISKVKLSVDGDGKVILGHLDLSDPLLPNYTFESNPAASHPVTVVPNSSKTKKGQP